MNATLTMEQCELAQRIAERIERVAMDEIRSMAEMLASKPFGELVGQTEFQLRDVVMRIGAKAMETALNERKKGGYGGSSTTCPHCGESARFQRWQEKTIVTLLGEARIERSYYYCPSCRAGHSPTDTALGLTARDQTPGAEQVIAMTGATDSFAAAAKRALRVLTGLRVSASTVERTTEAVGERLGNTLEATTTLGEAAAWSFHRDAEGKTCAYVSADATGVGIQGPKGAKAEGRMANVTMIDNPVPDDSAAWSNPQARRKPEWQARYLAGQASMPEQLRQLRAIGAAVGMDAAERWIALSDGGVGLEDALRGNTAWTTRYTDAKAGRSAPAQWKPPARA